MKKRLLDLAGIEKKKELSKSRISLDEFCDKEYLFEDNDGLNNISNVVHGFYYLIRLVAGQDVFTLDRTNDMPWQEYSICLKSSYDYSKEESKSCYDVEVSRFNEKGLIINDETTMITATESNHHFNRWSVKLHLENEFCLDLYKLLYDYLNKEHKRFYAV